MSEQNMKHPQINKQIQDKNFHGNQSVITVGLMFLQCILVQNKCLSFYFLVYPTNSAKSSIILPYPGILKVRHFINNDKAKANLCESRRENFDEQVNC